MSMEILDGNAASRALAARIEEQVAGLVSRGERAPHLMVIIVGNNPASETYVRNIERKCKALGFLSTVLRLPAETREGELLSAIDRVNADDGVDGLIVQMPLPECINAGRVIARIDPSKDMDGVHPINLGRLLLGVDCYRPATPEGILLLMQHYGISARGKHVVVLGRSAIVGLPVANMLVQKGDPGDGTVTVCHSKTANLAEVLRSADILIVAMGVPEFVKGDMVKPGAVVVDVGINSVADASAPKGWRLVGDVHYDEVASHCSYITPVPGGVGPMTIMALMQHTLHSRMQRQQAGE